MRIQFDIPNEYAERLDALMLETSIETRKDLFNYALTLFNWAVDERKDGKMIVALDARDGCYKQLVLPPLQKVAAVSRQPRSVKAIDRRLWPENRRNEAAL